MIGTLRTTFTPGVFIGTRIMLIRSCDAAAASLTPSTIEILQRGSAAPEMNHFRPETTYESPSSRIVVARFVGSDDATSGSVMEKQERISPRSRGSSQDLRWSGVAKRCSTSMLPVSGAEQLKTSLLQKYRPR